MPLTLYGGGQSIIQVASQTIDGAISSSSAGAPSTITSGVQIFSLNFTPLSATSNILVQTSTISIEETSNSGDICWLALWTGSTFVAANSGCVLYNHFSGNLNMAHHSINHITPSWGTSAQTVQVRGGMNAGAVYINGNNTYVYTGSSARISMTVMEIATS
jgi:hypothetical protein